ncbi:alpha/beta fold hydrolase [Streptomyces sp. NPDC097619]|uniref:alpha/beta hydrolase family protein n=1 Tax=Streptomyces sp. NPDC097619 TaxID=3157228 RepID=UPI00332884DD
MTTSAQQPQIRVLSDASRDHLREPGRPRPVRLYLWEPAEPRRTPAPLVVVSHGTGGSGGAMEWLVDPLRAAGFRVLALDHHGNNRVDGYAPEGFLHVWDRPRDVSFALDALAAEGPLGPVGAAGFSLGGYTAAALAGARVDPRLLWAVVTGAAPLPEIPGFPGVLDALRARYRPGELTADSPTVRRTLAEAAADLTDPRVRAVFQVAPGAGVLVSPESLATVRVPVAVHWGGADTISPYATDTRPYLEHVPTAVGTCVGPGVRHEDFSAAEPADPEARGRTGRAAAVFFRRYLG